MPGIGGLETVRKIMQRTPKAKILILTMHLSDPFPAKLLEAGASGYLSKDSNADELITAIRAIHKGKRKLSPEIAERLAVQKALKKPGSPFDALSDREFQTMLEVVRGTQVKTIAEKLNLSPKTINALRYRMFAKLGISNDVELTHMALRYGILDLNLPAQKETLRSNTKELEAT